jgi:hypothetical protein
MAARAGTAAEKRQIPNFHSFLPANCRRFKGDTDLKFLSRFDNRTKKLW